MLFPAKEATLSIHGNETDYLTFGSGPRQLIMIQGLNTRPIRGSALMLAWMYRIFAKAYTVYLFDRRKHVDENTTVRDFAGDIAAAMDALSIRDACVLGVSQGGMIAQHLAIDRPDLVSRMVLAVTASRNNGTIENTIARWIEMTERGEISALIWDMAVNMYSDAYIRMYRPLLPLLTVLQKPKDVRRFVLLCKSCLTCNAYEALDQIKCPVLVIGGGQDKVVGEQASREIANRLGCMIHLYETLGHAAYEEAPDFNRRVFDFFAE